MKFVCDRCKTRYSIGDDRVRGKILKIRCKSCSNVITVREGMPSPDGAEADPAVDPAELGDAGRAGAGRADAGRTGPAGLGGAVERPAAGAAGQRRAHKTTTAAPAVQSESLAPPMATAPARGALGAAFASAMTKPVPALEDEWYVSLDGDQVGPLALAEAQRWITERPADAELFCWREGFDDWLPVDKISHFRGLRKPAATPPPAPRTPAGASRGPAAAEASAAPRPLFAATMAQLEQDAAPSELRGLSGSRPNAAPHAQARLANGVAPAGRGGLTSPFPARAVFDASDSATQLDPGLHDPHDPHDAAVTAPRLPALARGAAPATLDPADLGPADPGLGFLGLGDPSLGPDPGGGDDLDIGEVSRVVKLADLARDAGRRNPKITPPPPLAAPGPVRSPTGAYPTRLEVPRLGDLAPSPLASGTGHAAVLLPAPEVPPPVSHRRAMIALIAGAIVLVGVAVAVVLFVVTGRDEQGGSRLGQVDEIDTTRPEELRSGGSGGEGSAAVAVTDPPAGSGAPRIPKRIIMQPTGPGSAALEGPAAGARLEARDIEDMASKNSGITQRCYMRAQRGADGILLGDVKKIAVTLTINADGQVTDAQLSDNHAQDSLGKCLIGAIRGWRFRASPGGTFRFVLHFG